jgi:hypothetical protein
VRLGPDLEALVRDVGTPLLRARPISPFPSRSDRGRSTFVLDFADGRRIKGRRLDTEERAATVERLLRVVRSARVPRPLARRGAALLEPWIAGSVLAAMQPTASHLRVCGRLLGRIHAMETVTDTTIVARRYARLIDVVRDLAATGALLADDSRALSAIAERYAPGTADVGIIHGDYCPENMVVTSNGALRLVDNEAVAKDAVDYDLARLWYRWPMSKANAAVVMGAYGTTRETRPFLRHFPFWAACVLADAALFRLSHGASTAAAPLDRLHRLAARPDDPPWGVEV